MQRYLSRLILFLVPLGGLLIALEAGLRSIPNNYTYTREYLLEHGDSIEILILGNSHAFNGIDPFGFDAPAFNAASVSQDHKRDLAILERFIDKLPALKHIILPVSYYSIGAMLEEGREPWRIKNYVLYLDMPDQASQLTHRFELLSSRKLRSIMMIAEHVLNDSTHISCLPRGGAPGKPKPGLDFSLDGRNTAERHTFGKAGRFKENRGYLEKLIRISSERDIHVHFFHPPGHQAYRAFLDSGQLVMARELGRELAEGYDNVTYHDLLEDDRFVESDFSNSDHLQKSGTVKLTRILREDLAACRNR